MEELGGRTRRSAPTPSVRLPHSLRTPEVSPTIIRIKTTWIAMARMLRKHRKGRAARLPQNIWRREKGPSWVSAMENIAERTVPSWIWAGQSRRRRERSKYEARAMPKCNDRILSSVKFCTQVLISLWKEAEKKK